MQWFADAKLGIFIHWGIYAVNGIDESWSFFNGYLSPEDYLAQSQHFTAENYDPEAWTSLIKNSGARYTVITSKHHDGMALWDTKMDHLNVVKDTPAGRDLLTPFTAAVRKAGLKLGIYYSLPDWSHPDYPNQTRTQKRYTEDADRWQRFLNMYQGQIGELASKYRPDLWWFDGDWEFSPEQWETKKVGDLLRQNNPNTIINARLPGQGDYATPEQGLPVISPTEKHWELCMTMNDSWGYQGNDKNYKTINETIQIFADVISNGGNLLLDIGPKADGTIPAEQQDILKGLGRWTKKHETAIFGTKAGIQRVHFGHPSTLSADSTILYLFVPGIPSAPLMLKGLKNKINRIWVVGNGTKLNHRVLSKAYWSSIPGIVFIDVPTEVVDEEMTVIAVLLDGKIDLYTSE
ncbi:MAG: alpha-L-fucosidase [Saprospiraceae bacterium]|nr:MAG: alpha-L-fucosidase [Saprospiraceae bacterium]